MIPKPICSPQCPPWALPTGSLQGSPALPAKVWGGVAQEQAGWASEAGLGVHPEGSGQRMAPIPDRAWIWDRRTVSQQSPRASWKSGLGKLNPTAKAEGKLRSSAWLGAGSLGMPEHSGVSLDGLARPGVTGSQGPTGSSTAWSCYWLRADPSGPIHPILGCVAQSPGLTSWLCIKLGSSPCSLPTQVQCL